MYYNTGLLSYAVLYNLLMLKLYKNNISSPDKGFYSLSLLGKRVAMKRAFVKALKNRLRMNEV